MRTKTRKWHAILKTSLHRAVLSSLLFGCSVATADERSATQQLPLIPHQLPHLTPGPSITLSEALHRAEQRNMSLAATKKELHIAQGRLQAAWSTLIPSISGTLSLTHNDHPDTAEMMGNSIEVRAQDDLKGTLQVSIPLINAQQWNSVGLARLDVAISALTVNNARQTLLLTVAQAYVQALTVRSLITVQENQLRSAQHHLQVAEIRYRSGTGQRLDLVRARTEVITAYEELRKAHTSLENARDALGVLVGAQALPLPATPPRLGGIPARALTSVAEEKLDDSALAQREDVKLARQRIELSRRQLKAAWLQFVPSLNGTWQLSYQLIEPSSFGSTDRLRWFAGLTLSVPIYTHSRYADLKQRRAERRRAELQLEDTKRTAQLALRSTRRSLAQAEELARTSQHKAQLADESLTLTEAAYESGTGSSLAVTDARRTSRTAALDLLTKQLAVQLAWIELRRARGEDMAKLENK